MINPRAVFARQLHAELPYWITQGWVSDAQAQQLAAQYPLPHDSGGQGWQIFLSILAALCVGGGVIALFAANWHELTRPMRVALSLAPLLLAQGAVLYALRRQPQSTAWRESSALAVALAVGASIALIAQTYHIESQGRFLHTWLWLTLPLPYLTGSWASAFFVAFLAHAFGISKADLFGHHDLSAAWQYLAYLAALLPWLVIMQAKRGAGYAGQTWLWRTFINVQVLCMAVTLLLLFTPAPFSMLLFVAAAYLLCRAWCGDSLIGLCFAATLGVMYLQITELDYLRESITWLQTACVAPLYLCVLPRWQRVRVWEWAFAMVAIALHALYLTLPDISGYVWSWVMAFAVVILGIWQLRLALAERRYIAINAAFVWVLAALFGRFIDGQIPLWIKGVIFIAGGLALLALNRYAARHAKGARS